MEVNGSQKQHLLGSLRPADQPAQPGADHLLLRRLGEETVAGDQNTQSSGCQPHSQFAGWWLLGSQKPERLGWVLFENRVVTTCRMFLAHRFGFLDSSVKTASASLTKDVYLPPRSKTLVNVSCPRNELQVLDVNVKGCHQVYLDQYLLRPVQNIAQCYLTNVSNVPQRLQKGTNIGHLESVEPDELLPWSVASTTPLNNSPPRKPPWPLTKS